MRVVRTMTPEQEAEWVARLTTDRLFEGYTPQPRCQQCGKRTSAELCRTCRIKRTDCPGCGNRKSHRARMCASCSHPKKVKPPKASRPTAEQRFWAKVDTSGDCWEWQGRRFPTGYGGFYAGGRVNWYAHRFVWTLVNGAIPQGMHVCHHCDNPPCVRPDHLFLGTPKDNMRDRDRKGRSRFGPNAPNGPHKPSPPRAFCRRGHEMTTENTTIYRNGTRRCKACVRIISNNTYWRGREKGRTE